MGTLLFGQKYSWPSATIAQAWNQEQPLQYHHPVRVQNGRQQFCVITIMALHGETMSPMPLCWNRLAPWPCISFSVSIAKICNFWQLLAVMKPITLHPDLRWSHQFFALSPYTFTIAQNFPTPPLPHLFHHHQRNPPTYPDTRPNISSHIQDEWKFIDHYYAWNSIFTFLCSMRKNKGKRTLTKTAVTAVYMQR